MRPGSALRCPQPTVTVSHGLQQGFRPVRDLKPYLLFAFPRIWLGCP